MTKPLQKFEPVFSEVTNRSLVFGCEKLALCQIQGIPLIKLPIGKSEKC